MTRAELRDARLRVLAGEALSLDEQLRAVEALDRLVAMVVRWADPSGDVNKYHFADVGREAVVIVREERIS